MISFPFTLNLLNDKYRFADHKYRAESDIGASAEDGRRRGQKLSQINTMPSRNSIETTFYINTFAIGCIRYT